MITEEEIIEFFKDKDDYVRRFSKDQDNDWLKIVIENYYRLDDNEKHIFNDFLINELKENKNGYSLQSIFIFKYTKNSNYLDEMVDIYFKVKESRSFFWKHSLIKTLFYFKYKNNLDIYHDYFEIISNDKENQYLIEYYINYYNIDKEKSIKDLSNFLIQFEEMKKIEILHLDNFIYKLIDIYTLDSLTNLYKQINKNIVVGEYFRDCILTIYNQNYFKQRYNDKLIEYLKNLFNF